MLDLRPKRGINWQTVIAVLAGLFAALSAYFAYRQTVIAQDALERSERPYVLQTSAFWRNGTQEAVVQFKNSGKTPAYQNRTRIHFVATTDRSPDVNLEWKYVIPAFSTTTVAPGAEYNTPALTRLGTIPHAEQDLLSGKAVAYVFGDVSYKDGFGKTWTERYCYMYDATRSSAFLGCPETVK